MRAYVRATDAWNVAVAEMCKAEGAVYVPVSEELHGGTDVFRDHCHLFYAGIARKAEIIFAHVKEYFNPQRMKH